MAILKRDDILQASDIVTELVPVPEWGGDVYVRALDGEQLGKFTTQIMDKRKGGEKVNLLDIREKLVVFSVVDEDGKRLFTAMDIAALSKKSSSALMRIFVVAQRLSGLGDNDLKEMANDLRDDPLGYSAFV